MTAKLILASESPRRQELLRDLGIEFEIRRPDFVEIEKGESAHELARINAEGKAQSLIHEETAIVISADTVVALEDQIIGKPKDREDAKRIINFLAGTKHQVITAFSILDTKTGRIYSEEVTTSVQMTSLCEQEIEAYLNTNDWQGKAGAYGIQGYGALFIEKIEGDYFNVVGLPLNRLFLALKQFEFNLFDRK